MLPYHVSLAFSYYMFTFEVPKGKKLIFSCSHYRKWRDFISSPTSAALLADCAEETPTSCNKETGEKKHLQKWSRGHFFYCSRQWIYWQMESPFPVCEPWLILFHYIYSCFEMLHFPHTYICMIWVMFPWTIFFLIIISPFTGADRLSS